MQGKKKYICKMFDSVNIADIVSWFRVKIYDTCIPILAYHRIIEESSKVELDQFPYEELNISSYSSEFEQQMNYIKKKFTTISFKDLKTHLNEGIKLPNNAVIITFDDGYKDNYSTAYRILRAYNLKATFFVPVGLMGGKGIIEVEKLTYAIKMSKKTIIDMSMMGLGRIKIDSSENKIRAKQLLIHEIRKMEEEIRREIVENILYQLSVEIPIDLANMLMLDWEDVKEMKKGGMEFGSHSMSHPILSRITKDRLREEVMGSKILLESMIEDEICAFAYPAGGKKEYFGEREKDAVKEAGYSFGVSYINGLENVKKMDNYAVKRVRISSYVDLPLFKMGLSFPWMLT